MTPAGLRFRHALTRSAVLDGLPAPMRQKLGGNAIHEQPARLSHVCFRTDAGITVVDVWASEEAFAAFGAILGPAVTKAGLTTPPVIYPVQGFMAADGVRNP